MSYDHQAIEKKWQKKWAEAEVFKTSESADKPKFYALDMFPYPSGVGLHVGHSKGYVATDVVARTKMMQGYNVLHPMGWDAFGLPAENYAIKNKIHPSEATVQNIETFKKQLSVLGFTYDWNREVNTTDPKYYKWTQWAFLQMFKKGLAYESCEPINWCPTCQTGLANEDLEGDKCERCGSLVEQKPMRQWVLKITDYADRLLADLDKLPEWPESIKQMQREWIGRSEGAEVNFHLSPSPSPSQGEGGVQPLPLAKGEIREGVKVFTTRPDTLFGATYMVLAPEHPLVSQITTNEQRSEVEAYVATAKNKTAIERGDDTKEKIGVFTGAFAINPVNDEEIPIWVADYVLCGYGTGAIMAVPAHDERDHAFARKYNLPEKIVVEPVTGEPKENEEYRQSIVAVVRNPKTNEFLSINWGSELGGNLFIGGGRDSGEDPINCARREVAEETGYTNLKFVSQTEIIHHHYFAFSKNKQRNIDCVGLYFELESEERTEQKLEANEKEKFKVEWISAEDADNKIVERLHELVFDRLVKDNCYVGDGLSVNSGFLNNLPTWKAKDDMISWLEENGLGQRKVQYKLRDWVFSRQRYWGEPIPLIHCDACKNKIEKKTIKLSFWDQVDWRRLISGRKTIETRALNLEEPERYFGNVRVGQYLCVVNKVASEEKYFRVTKVWQFKNLEELFDHPELLNLIAPDDHSPTLENWKIGYGKNAPDYLARIEKNGLIAWQVEMVTPGIVSVPESELPLELPSVEHYEPSSTGESPLATIDEWVNTKCPVCGSPAKHETNTMPQWAGSCWYYLRYCDPKNNESFFGQGFQYRPAIEPTEKDKKYFFEFKKIYSSLAKKEIKVWAGNRFLLNGLNRALWLPLRTIALVAWEKDRAEIEQTLMVEGFTLTEVFGGTNYLYEKDDVRLEIIAISRDQKGLYSQTAKGFRQDMKESDLPEAELGLLWNFTYRILSPEYNLEHYKFIAKEEAAIRQGLGDENKIAFLQEWVEKNNLKLVYWNPVDLYVGGAEHATRHLIYARFWHKFLYDLGAVSGEEPFMRLQNVGLILAEDGRKMSKRWGNVINPDDVVREYGADALRVYEMFMGPFNQPAAWSTNGLVGTRRFLEKVNGLAQLVAEKENEKVTQALHQTIKKVGEDINDFRFNTAVAQMMTFVNIVGEEKGLTRESFLKFLRVLCPFAPHLANELAAGLGETKILESGEWPTYNPELLKANEIVVAVQVNGKLRGTVIVSVMASEEEVKAAAVVEDNVKKHLTGKEIKKVIFVKGKLVNIVVS